jgi:hypothetical protein
LLEQTDNAEDAEDKVCCLLSLPENAFLCSTALHHHVVPRSPVTKINAIGLMEAKQFWICFDLKNVILEKGRESNQDCKSSHEYVVTFYRVTKNWMEPHSNAAIVVVAHTTPFCLSPR